MKKLYTLLLIAMIHCHAFAVDFTAIASGPFSNPATWDANGVPPMELMSGDRIIINPGVSVDLINQFTVNSGEIINNGTFNITFDIHINDGTITNNGTFFVSGPSAVESYGIFLNNTTGFMDIEGVFRDLSEGGFTNLGTIDNDGIFESCNTIEGVSGTPVANVIYGAFCDYFTGNPTTISFRDDNCNCISRFGNAQIYVAGIDQPFTGTQSRFTPDICGLGVVSGIIELTDPILACDFEGPITNDFAGNIAVLDRGFCRFDEKFLNVQEAGASAVIICNNVPGLVHTNGDPDLVSIPTVLMSMEDCATLKLYEGSVVSIGVRDCGVLVPTLTQWGIVVLSLIIMIFGIVAVKQYRLRIA